MGSQDEQATLATTILNTSLQNVANYCSITCNNTIDNLNVTIIGGNDDITIGQGCSAIGSECMVKNIISSQVQNLIQNLTQQSESNLGIYSLLGPASSETSNITNSVKNQVSQLISNTCFVEDNNVITNSNVFAQDPSSLKLTIAQTGNVNKATCALDTISKLLINNDIKNTSKQTESSCGNILLILIIVAVILLVILIWPLLKALFRGAAGVIDPSNKVTISSSDGSTPASMNPANQRYTQMKAQEKRINELEYDKMIKNNQMRIQELERQTA
jgi:hypothetical protein